MRKFETMTRLNLDPAVRLIGTAVLILCANSAQAVGLGSIQVQSGLGQSLKVVVPLIGADNADLRISCIKFRIQSLDGVLITSPVASIIKSAQGQSFIQITTRQPVYEPAMSVSVDLACESQVHRDFQILLDPVVNLTDTLVVASPANTGNATGTRTDAGNTFIPEKDSARTKPATIAERNKRGAVGATSAPQSVVPLARDSRSATPRSVLKLSSQSLSATELLSLGQLKLSRQLTDPTIAGDVPSREELIPAQRRYAMLLRGEDPLLQTEQENIVQQKQISRLKQQFEAGKIQRAVDQVAFNELQKNSYPFEWIVGLLALLLGSLGTAGWLGWRMWHLRNEPSETAWDLSMLRTEPPDVPGLVENPVDASRPETAAANISVSEKKMVRESDETPSFLQDRAFPINNQVESVAPVVKQTDDSMETQSVVAHESLQFYPARVEHLKVEEISDVMQEAEFWLSLNDPVRAIEILEPYGKLEQPESPMPWLFLLDLYLESHDQSRYEELRERTIHTFNTRIPAWNEISDITPRMSLEDFPHVVDRICALWETDHVIAYLESLLLDNRGGVRRGFDIEVYQEVLLLMAMAKELSLDPPRVALND
ncbi:MAG: pilus assembly protein FimV [Burkholderiaceae bacterium]